MDVANSAIAVAAAAVVVSLAMIPVAAWQEQREWETFKSNPAKRGAGGRGGIRTHGGLAPTPVFKTGALNHSATLPHAAAAAQRNL
jgi:hypothetical protein